MKNKFLLSLILSGLIGASLFVQGCAPAVFVAGAAAATASSVVVSDNRSPKVILEDRDTTFQAQAKINSDQELRTKTHIEAVTFNRVVLLVGQAATEQLRQRAVTLVGTLPAERVKLIRNEIALGNPATESQHLHDTWFTTKIKSRLLAENALHSAKMKIVTEDGVVYIMGLVTKGQGNLAAQVVSEMDGVKRVVKLFEYVK
jgi:osmotically-inducible protein OsmY